MKRFGLASFAMLVLVVSLLAVHRPQPAFAKDQEGKPTTHRIGSVNVVKFSGKGNGSIFDDGLSFSNLGRDYHNAIPIHLFVDDGVVRKMSSFDRSSFDRWSPPELEPGLYQIIVTPRDDSDQPYRLRGIAAKQGDTSHIDVTFCKTKAAVYGGSLIKITPGWMVSEAEARMQKKIDTLTKENESLKARLEKLGKK